MIRAVAALTSRNRSRDPGGKSQCGRPGAGVDAADRAEPPLAQDIGGVIEVVDDLAFGVEPPVVEDQNQFGISGDRLLFIHDDHAMEPAPELFAGKRLNQWLIEKGSGVRRGETEVSGLARGDGLLHEAGGAVDFIGDPHAAPMQGGGLIKPVDQPRLDFLTELDPEKRAGNVAGKTPDFGRRRRRGQEGNRAGARFQQGEAVGAFGRRRCPFRPGPGLPGE